MTPLPAPRLRTSVVQSSDYVKPRGFPAGGKQTAQRDRADNNMPSKRGNAVAPWIKAKTCQPPGPPPCARRQNHWPRQRHRRLSPDPRPSQAGFMVGQQPWLQTAIFARRESATVARLSRNGSSKEQAASRTTPGEVVQYMRIKVARFFHHPWIPAFHNRRHFSSTRLIPSTCYRNSSCAFQKAPAPS